MTTLVAQATNVVKLFALTPVPSMARHEAVKLHERIAWVQKDLGTKGIPASLQVLAERAEVSRQVLQQWVAKSIKGKSPGRGETFTRCAEAWNVSLDWLQRGVGEPRPSAFEPLEHALDAEPWAPAAVAAAKAHYDAGARLSQAEWHRFLRSVHELTAASAEASNERTIHVNAISRRSKREAG
jgi:transcriptional regulator with XRE-family HTH domain